MCQAKPGPRCHSHLRKADMALAEREDAVNTKLRAATHAFRQLDLEGADYSALEKQVREELAKEGVTSPSEDMVEGRIYGLRRGLKARKDEALNDVARLEQERDAVQHHRSKIQRALLGTRTGQKQAEERIAQMEADGTAAIIVNRYKRVLEQAKEERRDAVEYGKFAKRVRDGELPGRFVQPPSDDPDVADVVDPVYDATYEELSQLSSDDVYVLEKADTSGTGLSPSTREKLRDLNYRKRGYTTREEEIARARKLSNSPADQEMWATVLDKRYNGNYFEVNCSSENDYGIDDATEIHHLITTSSPRSSVRSSGASLVRQVRTYDYEDVLPRTVAKDYALRDGYKVHLLVLDDGKRVEVPEAVHKALRLDLRPGFALAAVK